MKSPSCFATLLVALSAQMMAENLLAQGEVNFNNRAGTVDARVTFCDGGGIGAGFTAQLFGGPEGGALTPLVPTLTFRTSSAAAMGYTQGGVVVSVPGVPP